MIERKNCITESKTQKQVKPIFRPERIVARTRVARKQTAVVGPQESPPGVKDLRQSHRPNPLKIARLEEWRCRGAAVQPGQAEGPQVALDRVALQALRSEIRRVFRPWDL